jgi:hypothetical protein
VRSRFFLRARLAHAGGNAGVGNRVFFGAITNALLVDEIRTG